MPDTPRPDRPRDPATEAPDPARHTVDDHMFGDFHAHHHDGDADHDHDDIDPGPLEDNPIWQRDNVALTSVGIDIGSAGTQVIFSTVHLQRRADSHASRYVIVDRATAFASPVTFTPFASETEIDAQALGAIIDDAYAAAGIRPTDIDTGVVILTGEALRRENAEAIAGIVAEKGGDFVTATAGNHMEAMLAAYGSGAAKLSHDRHARILNVDIGGGTTKLALIDGGAIRWTAALHVGGRLIATEAGRVSRAEPAGRHFAAAAGMPLAPGDPADAATLAHIAAHMAGVLETALTVRPLPEEVARLFLTDVPDLPDMMGPTASTASSSRAASAPMSRARRPAISAISACRSAPRFAPAPRPARSAPPRCPPATRSAPPHSAPRNIRCSCPARPPPSPPPDACCRAATSRC